MWSTTETGRDTAGKPYVNILLKRGANITQKRDSNGNLLDQFIFEVPSSTPLYGKKKPAKKESWDFTEKELRSFGSEKCDSCVCNKLKKINNISLFTNYY